MAALPHHAWEDAPAIPHLWEGSSDDDSDDDLDPLTNKTAAAAEMLESLFDLYYTSSISAQVFCVICFWAGKAGVPGEAARYGKRPGLASGHYQRHLDEVLGFKAEAAKLYEIDVAGHRKADMSRTNFKLKVRIPYESIDDELKGDPAITVRLQEAIDNGDLPQSYFEHPVVLGTPDPVLPLALYMDGLPYSLTDSVVGVWLVNLITNSRSMVAVVRKRLVCKCGCAGWCTFYPLLLFLHWIFTQMAEGVLPLLRHDHAPFTCFRQALGGVAMRIKSCLLYLKGDWPEFCERFGYPTWASTMRPCLSCNGFGDSLYSVLGVGPLGLPWRENTDQDYEGACRRCEYHIDLTPESHSLLKGLLVYDKRKGGSHGRALLAPAPTLALLAGDRLEPSPRLPDVGPMFDSIAVFPFPVVFWRPVNATLCTHRCPLMDESLGITPCRSICFDLLHTLYLGPMQTWCRLAIWKLILNGVWGAARAPSAEQIILSILAMRAELFSWYKARHAAYPDENLTRVSDMTPKMIGTPNDPLMKTKAMETYGFLLFLIDMLAKYGGDVGNDAVKLQEAGQLIVRYLAILRSSPINMSAAHVQERTPPCEQTKEQLSLSLLHDLGLSKNGDGEIVYMYK